MRHLRNGIQLRGTLHVPHSAARPGELPVPAVRLDVRNQAAVHGTPGEHAALGTSHHTG